MLEYMKAGRKPAAVYGALALYWLLALPALAGDLQDGKAAYLARDYPRALQLLRPLAEQGEAAAQVTLGIMYDYGHGVPEDNAQAAEWYRRAALQGNPNLQHNLGVKYFSGIDIPQDYAEARKWWRMAAGNGFAESQYNLAETYAWGTGTVKNLEVAAKWYRLAAEQNHDLAQYRLGVLHAAGRGVALDHAQAFAWLRKAAGQGMPQAQYQVGRLYENGVGVTRDTQQALHWYRLAAALGFEKASRRLAGLKERGPSPLAVAAPDDATDPAPQALPGAREEVDTQSMATRAGAAGSVHGEEWVRAQPPGHFTVQLATVSSEQSVMAAIGNGGYGSDAAYFKRDLDGRTAYTIICGVYASREQAGDALARLPAAVRRAKPWVRPFADLQPLLLPQ